LPGAEEKGNREGKRGSTIKGIFEISASVSFARKHLMVDLVAFLAEGERKRKEGN